MEGTTAIARVTPLMHPFSVERFVSLMPITSLPAWSMGLPREFGR
jgi:hypothetical protein